MRKIPDHAGKPRQLPIQGGDEIFLALAEFRTPLFLWLQVDKILSVEKAGGICTIVGPPDLTGGHRDFRKRSQNDAGLIRQVDAFTGASTRREGAANPDRAFVQVRQKLRPDGLAERVRACQTEHRRAHCDPMPADRES